MGKTVRIGTRGSRLARAQADMVAEALRREGAEVTLLIIRTRGDEIQDRPLAEIGGKGLFVKEIEQALLDERVDVAVHSMKDLPAELAPGCVLAAVPPREDARDALVSADGKALEELPPAARVGTSSLRRKSQLLAARPDLVVEPLRGNVDTRLRRLDEGRFRAIVLAMAGMRRLGLSVPGAVPLDETVMVPAVGQGALGIEIRGDDDSTRAFVTALHDEATAACVAAERAFLATLEGSCHVPVGALAVLEDGGARLRLEGLLAEPEGTRVLRGARVGPPQEGPALGRELASEILARGGKAILDALDLP